MIKLKDLLFESIESDAPGVYSGTGPAWNMKSWELIKRWQVPVSPTLIKKHIGEIRITTFHITDINGLQTIKSELEGSAKSLSTFLTFGEDSSIMSGYGVQSEGGIILEVEGLLLGHSIDDMSTQPDESGRRWIHPTNFKEIYGVSYNIDTLKRALLKKPSYKKVKKKIDDVNKQNKSAMDMDKYFFQSVEWYVKNFEKKSFKSKLIKDYMDMVEKEVWKKNSSKIKKTFGKNLTGIVEKFSNMSWNELVISNIKVKDILYMWNDDMSESDYEEIQKLTKKVATGTVYERDWYDDTADWIKKRGGVVII